MELAQKAYQKNKKDLIPNLFFMMIIFLISRYTFVGVYGFWLIAIIVSFQLLRYIFNLILGIILLFMSAESVELRSLKWKTTFVMTIEILIDIIFILPLYNYFY